MYTLEQQMNIFERDDDLFLEVTRRIAAEVARQYGEVTADDVRVRFQKEYPHVQWRRAAGAIFRSGEFEPTGEFRKSAMKRRRSGRSLVWRLRGPRTVD